MTKTLALVSAEGPGSWEEWGNTAPLETPEELQKQVLEKRIEDATKGWPWNGAPPQLVTLVRIPSLHFVLPIESILAGSDVFSVHLLSTAIINSPALLLCEKQSKFRRSCESWGTTA